MQLDGRLVMKSLMNVLVNDLEVMHHDANMKGYIPEIRLDLTDQSKIQQAAEVLLGSLKEDGAVRRLEDRS